MKKNNKNLFINGQWIEGKGKHFISTNPVTDEVLLELTGAHKHDIDAAVQAARQAFVLWQQIPFEEKQTILEKFAQLLSAQKTDMATTISQEMGKPLWESLTEVDAMINKVPISIEAFKERTADKSFSAGTATRSIHYKPHGVVAVLGPFNFPGHLPNGHIVPALFAGNTIVFKPSEQTPLVGQKLVKLFQESGLPSGVLNLIQGGGDVGEYLSQHEDLNGLFFTGSYQVGAAIHKAFAGHPEKILALEMGGNNPLIAFEIKDFKAAAYLIIQSAFITSGQRCSCARRLIIEDSEEGEKLLANLMDMTQKIVVGPFDQKPEPFMGSVISDSAVRYLLNAKKELVKSGGKSLAEMELIGGSKTLLSPGIIDMTNATTKYDEEIFGPLLQVIRVKTFNDALKEANNTAFGLICGLLSDDVSLYNEMVRRAHAGIIHFNRATTGASSQSPFGGIGKSGNHRPSAYFASDYCSYPVATMEEEKITLPKQLTPGVVL
jgi:succinylglutamic semialdehyde dehydrogenase